MYPPISKWDNRARDINPNGYVLVWVPEHPKSFCGGWYYEHRLVVERQLKRVLETWETVHHINEVKTDNFEDNLFCCTRQEHDYAV